MGGPAGSTRLDAELVLLSPPSTASALSGASCEALSAVRATFFGFGWTDKDECRILVHIIMSFEQNMGLLVGKDQVEDAATL